MALNIDVSKYKSQSQSLASTGMIGAEWMLLVESNEAAL